MPIPTPTPRARRVTEMFDFTRGHGLEIGPLHQPLIPRSEADVAYADVFDKATLLANHANNALVTEESVPEIDFTLWDGERVRTIDEAVKPGAPYDWVYASHVIEHVPDLIGWLQQIEAITVEGGSLVLVIPDRRYCFDAHRPPTTVGQMLQAHEDGDVVPSVRAVYDHHRSAVSATARDLWRVAAPGYGARVHDLGFVRGQLERARAGEYVDCHVWTFTDTSFCELVDELRAMGLSHWHVESLTPVPRDQLEFYVVLRRGSDTGHEAEQDPAAAPDWFASQQELRQDVVRLRRKVRRLRRALASSRERSRALTASRRWKAAGLLAAPLDAWRRGR